MSEKPSITIIGRGHSGTRAISHTLTASGVFMGAPQNDAGDLLSVFAVLGGMIVEQIRVFCRGAKCIGVVAEGGGDPSVER